MAEADTIRIASFNAALARQGAGVLLRDFDRGDPQIDNVVEIVQRVRPDILLINELDHDPGGRAAAALVRRLAGGEAGIHYAHVFADEVNTGVPSGHDLDRDGRKAGPRDAFGFGRFPGQYGMALLSRYPVAEARTFRLFRWAVLPGALRPAPPGRAPYHAEEVWQALRLSSKSHWDVAVPLPDGRVVHLLASHPTPPVFDGPEDLNGRRNADEIRFWLGHIDGADWVVDDAGRRGGLADGALFVVLGDLNADPKAGESRAEGIAALLAHPRVRDPGPRHAAAGPLGLHTAHWPLNDGPKRLRVDYVLPSDGLEVADSGVFWPARGDPLHRLVAQSGRKMASSDHRLVWVDIRLEER